MKLPDGSEIHEVAGKFLQFQYAGLREPWGLDGKAALPALLKLSRENWQKGGQDLEEPNYESKAATECFLNSRRRNDSLR